MLPPSAGLLDVACCTVTIVVVQCTLVDQNQRYKSLSPPCDFLFQEAATITWSPPRPSSSVSERDRDGDLFENHCNSDIQGGISFQFFNFEQLSILSFWSTLGPNFSFWSISRLTEVIYFA